MKRNYVITFLFCILLGFFCIFGEKTALADEETRFVWEGSKDGTVCITEIIGIETLTELEIPETIDGKWVTGLKFNVLVNAGKLRKIYFPSRMNNISNQMFWNCTTLEDIHVAEGNENYVSIDGMLFMKLRDGLRLECVPVKKLGSYFEIPQEATYIARRAINHCYTLKTVVLHENIKKQSAVLSSDGTDYIYEAVNYFATCYNLKEIIVDEKNTDFTSENGVLYTKDKKILVAFPAAFESSEYSVPDGVEKIGWEAFYHCRDLVCVTTPSSLREIGRQAFSGCLALKEIVLKEGLKRIEGLAFEECRGLAKATLPASVETLGADVFLYCDLLNEKQEETPETLFVREERADGTVYITRVMGIETLEKLVIPEEIAGKKVTGMDIQLLYEAERLKELWLPSGIEELYGEMFINCNALEAIHVPEKSTYFESQSGVLYRKVANRLELIKVPAAKKIVSFVMPQRVQYSDEFAFYGCEYPETVTINAGYMPLDFYKVLADDIRYSYDVFAMFLNCPNLKYIDVEKENPEFVSVNGILYTRDGKTLVQCPQAYEKTEIVVPDGVEKIAYAAFEGCRGITSVVLPDTVKKISAYAFSGCISLENVVMREGLQELEPDAFSSCRMLSGIVLPTTLERVGVQCFTNCESLTIVNEEEHRKDLLQAIREGTAWSMPEESVWTEPSEKLLDKVTGLETESGIFRYRITTEEELILTGLTESARKDKKNRNLVIPPVLDGYPVLGIAEGAFAYVPLTSVQLPEGITEIGKAAFYGCNLTGEVYLPASVRYLGERVFGANYALKAILVSPENVIYTSKDGVLFSKDGTVLLQMPAGKDVTNYGLSQEVRIIGEYAFGNHGTLTAMTMPHTVKEIRSKAFWNMISLREFVIRNDEAFVAPDALLYCPLLGNGESTPNK